METGKFKKGNIPWNKGLTKETDERIKRYWLGKHRSEVTKKKISQKFKGKTYEEISGVEKAKERKEHMKKMYPIITKKRLKTMKQKDNFYRPVGNLNVSKRPEVAKKISLANKGKHNSVETEFKEGQRSWMKGKKHNFKAIQKIKKSLRKWHKNNKHPKGMLGKENKWGSHTKKSIKKIKEARGKQIFPIKDTSIEVIIQNFLKKLRIEFFTHFYIKKIELAYRCDIFIPSMNFIIETDGDYWHGNPEKFPNLNKWQKEQRKEDKLRTQQLLKKGYNVMRIWESEIKVMELNEFKNKLNQVKND